MCACMPLESTRLNYGSDDAAFVNGPQGISKALKALSLTEGTLYKRRQQKKLDVTFSENETRVPLHLTREDTWVFDTTPTDFEEMWNAKATEGGPSGTDNSDKQSAISIDISNCRPVLERLARCVNAMDRLHKQTFERYARFQQMFESSQRGNYRIRHCDLAAVVVGLAQNIQEGRPHRREYMDILQDILDAVGRSVIDCFRTMDQTAMNAPNHLGFAAYKVQQVVTDSENQKQVADPENQKEAADSGNQEEFADPENHKGTTDRENHKEVADPKNHMGVAGSKNHKEAANSENHKDAADFENHKEATDSENHKEVASSENQKGVASSDNEKEAVGSENQRATESLRTMDMNREGIAKLRRGMA